MVWGENEEDCLLPNWFFWQLSSWIINSPSSPGLFVSPYTNHSWICILQCSLFLKGREEKLSCVCNFRRNAKLFRMNFSNVFLYHAINVFFSVCLQVSFYRNIFNGGLTKWKPHDNSKSQSFRIKLLQRQVATNNFKLEAVLWFFSIVIIMSIARNWRKSRISYASQLQLLAKLVAAILPLKKKAITGLLSWIV